MPIAKSIAKKIFTLLDYLDGELKLGLGGLQLQLERVVLQPQPPVLRLGLLPQLRDGIG